MWICVRVYSFCCDVYVYMCSTIYVCGYIKRLVFCFPSNWSDRTDTFETIRGRSCVYISKYKYKHQTIILTLNIIILQRIYVSIYFCDDNKSIDRMCSNSWSLNHVSVFIDTLIEMRSLNSILWHELTALINLVMKWYHHNLQRISNFNSQAEVSIILSGRFSISRSDCDSMFKTFNYKSYI